MDSTFVEVQCKLYLLGVNHAEQKVVFHALYTSSESYRAGVNDGKI